MAVVAGLWPPPRLVAILLTPQARPRSRGP